MRQLTLIGIILVAFAATLTVTSFDQTGTGMAHAGITITSLLMAAGAAWLFLLPVLRKLDTTPQLLIAVFLSGLAMRGLYLFSEPLLEIDFYRYLWDGVALAHGLNPYAISPADALTNPEAPAAWKDLAATYPHLVENINYAPLRTIYPPTAQFVFWVTALVPAELALFALRLLLIGFEVTTFFLLIRLLRMTGQSLSWVTLYWWNPLIIVELVNAAHMDAILTPFLLLMILFLSQRRLVAGSATLALAVGVKVWPILLTPLLITKGALAHRAKAVVIFSALLILLAIPLILGRLDGSSGFVAYAAGWTRNAALFPLIDYWVSAVLDYLDIFELDASRLTRLLIALIVGLIALFFSLKTDHTPDRLVRVCLIIAATLFLLSPTGYPWYYAWMAPFLVFIRSPALMALTALLPIYYLRFYFVDSDLVVLFDHYIVWLEFLPIYALLTLEGVRCAVRRLRS